MDKDRMEEIGLFISNIKMGRPFLTKEELGIVKKRYPDLESYLRKKEYLIDEDKIYFIEL